MLHVLRIVAKIALSIPLAVLGLGGLGWLALQVRPVRAEILERVLPGLEGSLEGSLAVDDVRWSRPDRIVLRGLTLRDRTGARAASIARASANLRLSALLSGRLVISRVEIEQPFVALAPGDPERGLLSLFASDEPAQPDGAPPQPVSPIPIEIESVCLRGGKVVLEASPDGRFQLQRLAGCAHVEISDAVALQLERLSGELSHEGRPVLALGRALAAAPELGRVTVDGKMRVGGTAEPRYDARLHATAISAGTLRALDVPAEWLRAKLAADVRLRGRGQRLEGHVVLAAADSRVRIDATLDAEQVLALQLKTDRLALAGWTAFELEPIAVTAKVRAELGGSVIPISLHVPGGTYGALSLPQLDARARVHEGGRVFVPSVTARYGAANLRATGARSADGAIHGEVELDVPALGAVPPLERAVAALGGSLAAEMTVDLAAGGKLSVRGQLAARDLRYGEQRAARLNAELQAQDVLTAPELDVALRASDLQVAGQHFDRLSLQVDGGPERFGIDARARGPQQLSIRGRVVRGASGWRSPWLRARAELAEGTASLQTRRVHFVPGERVQVGALSVRFLGAQLDASGRVDLERERVTATARVRAGDLGEITRALSAAEVPGQLRARAQVRGALQQPKLTVHANYWDGPRFGESRGRAELDAEVNLARGRARAELHAGAGPAGATLTVESRWRPGQQLMAALRSGRHELTADVSKVSFSAMRQVPALAGAPSLRGTLATQLHAEGNLQRLQVENRWQLELQPDQPGSPVRVRVDATYRDAKLSVRANARDERSRIAVIEADLAARLEPVLSKPVQPATLLAGHRWELAVDVPERRIAGLPGAKQLGWTKELAPVALSAKGEVTHAPGAEPQGELHAAVAWLPQRRPAEHAGCSNKRSARLEATAALRDGTVRLQLSGRANGRELVDAETATQLRLSEWASGRSLAMIPRHVRARIQQVDLSQLPYLCDRASGVVSGSIQAKQLFDPKAQVDVRLRAQRVRWQESPPLSGTIVAHAEPDGLSAAAQLRPGGGVAEVTAQLPIRFQVRDPALCIDRTAPLVAETRFQQVDIAAITGFVPGIARASGTLDGKVAVRGSLDAPRANGRLELEDVSFTLPQQGQRFSRIHATAVLDGRTLRLSEVVVRDRSGVARIDASMTFESLETWTAELDLEADDFPVRRTGILLGQIDTHANITARSTPDQLRVRVGLRNTDVVLSGAVGADVQSLERHPDIIFASELGEGNPTDEPAPDRSGIEAVLQLETSEPIWVRRDDFAAQMRADLEIRLTGEQTFVRGEVQLLRGYVSLLGQSFDIESGRVTFTGGEQIDPQLEITATQTAPSGVEVRLEVSGFVQKPELKFFVADKPVTAGEALTALTGARDGGEAATVSAQEELTSAAVGMTTGLLSLAARREFGDWVPMLAIEAGDQARVRVGFDADKLIPSFLSGFVRGAYVEGIVAQDTTETEARNAGSTRASPGGGGVLLELLLPANFVWIAQYGPGNTWSVDLNWRP